MRIPDYSPESKQVQQFIRQWVEIHFGQSEANDPSWSIELLGDYIANKQRLEELRQELRAECISYGELAELESLKSYIDAGDVELLEAAGVPEEA